MRNGSFLIIIAYCFLFLHSYVLAFNLSVTCSGGNGTWDNGVYKINKGSTVNFSVTPSNGTSPYTYCWDFGTPQSGSSLGTWDNEKKLICYSTSQNPSHTFNDFGEYEVWVGVKDSAVSPVIEKALIIVSVNVGGTVINPTTGCGANNLVGDGVTNNGAKLASCVNAASGSNITVRFPSGNYLFKSQNNFTKSAIQLEPAPDANVTISFDTVDDDEQDIFINHGANTVYIKSLNIIRNLGGESLLDRDRTVLVYGTGKAILYKCNVSNFSVIRDNGPPIFIRNNLLNWGGGRIGGGYYYQGGLAQGMHGNPFVKENYSKSQYLHQHWLYDGGSDFIYVVGNYVDMTNYITQNPTNIFNQFNISRQRIYRNLLQNTGEKVFRVDGGNAEIIDNKVSAVGYTFAQIAGNVGYSDVIFSYNHFSNNGPYNIFAMSGGNVTFTNNTFGINAPRSPGKIWECNNSITSNDPNWAGCQWLTATGNVVDNSTHMVSDPGKYEFIIPTVLSASRSGNNLTVSAFDEGSGLGSIARWPFTQGALIQVSDGSNNYSEVKAYSGLTSWAMTPYQVRVADVDHNWSDLTVVSFDGGPKPPIGLRITQ